MKINVALLTGGYSGESVISMRSAQNILQWIDKKKFDIYLLYITKEEWFYQQDGNKIFIDKNDFSLTLRNEKIHFDVALIMIHGTPGEDGQLQGYLEMMKIPFTSCSSAVSSITFHKYLCNNFVRSFGDINVAESILIQKSTHISPEDIIKKIGLPCFVKPEAGGSSIGTSKVTKAEQLIPAISKALSEDQNCMVEKFISGREITCGVIKYKNQVIAFPLTEICSKNDFFDYEAKYTPSLADEITPAPIDKQLTRQIQNVSVDLYKKLLCKGVVRFDYIVNNDGIWFLEVNTIPGMTSESIVPKQALTYGWSFTDLISNLILESLSS